MARTGCPRHTISEMISAVRQDKLVEVLDKEVSIDAVHLTGFLNIFAAGHSAAKAVHADGLEERRGEGRMLKNIGNDGFPFDLVHCFSSRD